MIDIDALEAKLAAATPGPWETDSELDNDGVVMAMSWSRLSSWANVAACNPHDPRRLANASLIAAAVTALPELLRLARVGQAAVEARENVGRALCKAAGIDPDDIISDHGPVAWELVAHDAARGVLPSDLVAATRAEAGR